jgi:hypothetical protein
MLEKKSMNNFQLIEDFLFNFTVQKIHYSFFLYTVREPPVSTLNCCLFLGDSIKYGSQSLANFGVFAISHTYIKQSWKKYSILKIWAAFNSKLFN